MISSSITASAVCLFILNTQFYDIFTGLSIKNSRVNDIDQLILNCSQSIPSIIDRDTVESKKQFLPYLASPLFIETMSDHIFTAINVISYKSDLFCLIVGTSKITHFGIVVFFFNTFYSGNGRLFTTFTDTKFNATIFEELTLPMKMSYSIKSIAYKKVYVLTNILNDLKNTMKLCEFNLVIIIPT